MGGKGGGGGGGAAGGEGGGGGVEGIGLLPPEGFRRLPNKRRGMGHHSSYRHIN